METYVLSAYVSALYIGACVVCFTTLHGSYISRHYSSDARMHVCSVCSAFQSSF
jgi:hypothetical protein